jgi:hypothetical protein
MAYSLSPWLKPRFFITGTNRPLAGGLMYTYKAGTTDPAKTYSDDSGTENTNPIVLNTDGECDLYLDDAVSYRIILKNALGVPQFDKDRVASIGNTQVQSFNSIAALRLRSGTTTANAAKTLGYYSAGDGGENTFYWDSTSVASDNGGTVIKPTSVSGAGRWLAVNSYGVYVRQFGAKGDGATDDTASITNAISASVGSVVFEPGVYVVTKITINKVVKFLGIRGASGAANIWPRLLLKPNTNTDMIYITTSGKLYAEKIDFYGNKANQSLTGSQTSTGIYLEEDTTPTYVAANSIIFTECLIRNFASKAIYCGKNRNGGRLYFCFLLDVDDAAFVLFGTDWYCAETEFGVCGGAALYTNFGSSNDFILCEFYYTGTNAAYGSSKSGIYIGNSVNSISITASQINACKHHGIECAATVGGSPNYIISNNQLGNNGLESANTFSNIYTAVNSAVIKGNNHWSIGQKPKYLIETVGVSRVHFDDVYSITSYDTAVTNDETNIFNTSGYEAITLGDGGYFSSRKSGNDRVYRSYANADTNEKFSIDRDGIHRWGAGGAGATDVALLRTVANVLELAGDDCFRTGLNTTANRPTAATVGVGCQFYDTTLRKPIWSDGAVWRDAAGTAV